MQAPFASFAHPAHEAGGAAFGVTAGGGVAAFGAPGLGGTVIEGGGCMGGMDCIGGGGICIPG